jgi:hypothetical protein
MQTKQASLPTDEVSLQTANDLLRGRLEEEITIAARERERADKLERALQTHEIVVSSWIDTQQRYGVVLRACARLWKALTVARIRARDFEREAEYWRKENRAVRDAAAATMEDALSLILPAVVLEQERNDLRIKLSAALARADAAEQENDRLRAENNRLCNDIAQLEHERDGADAYASEMEAHRKHAEARADAAERKASEYSKAILRAADDYFALERRLDEALVGEGGRTGNDQNGATN